MFDQRERQCQHVAGSPTQLPTLSKENEVCESFRDSYYWPELSRIFHSVVEACGYAAFQENGERGARCLNVLRNFRARKPLIFPPTRMICYFSSRGNPCEVEWVGSSKLYF